MKINDKDLIIEMIDKVIRENFESLNEIQFIKTETEFKEFYRIVKPNIKTLVYQFISDRGYSYDLEFMQTNFYPNLLMDDNRKFCDILKNINCNDKYNSIDLGFAPSERLENNKEINHKEYSQDTKRNEQWDVMNRIVYLVGVFVERHPQIMFYGFGRNTDNIKIKMYLDIYKECFSDNFARFDGKSKLYPPYGAIYFIHKSILK